MGRFENHVVKGGIKLPIGFRFCPTDEELLLHYLKKKAFAQQLPASVISEFDVFQTEPWKLPGWSEFFFSFLQLLHLFFLNMCSVGSTSISLQLLPLLLMRIIMRGNHMLLDGSLGRHY